MNIEPHRCPIRKKYIEVPVAKDDKKFNYFKNPESNINNNIKFMPAPQPKSKAWAHKKNPKTGVMMKPATHSLIQRMKTFLILPLLMLIVGYTNTSLRQGLVTEVWQRRKHQN